jgi:hypothetical protein
MEMGYPVAREAGAKLSAPRIRAVLGVIDARDGC